MIRSRVPFARLLASLVALLAVAALTRLRLAQP